MAEIMSAKCTVCGKIFEGKDCVQKAEEHEKIPIEEPIHKIGDTIMYPKSDGSCTIYKISTIEISTREHVLAYEGFTNFANTFRLKTDKIYGKKVINEADLLNDPYYEDLRNRIVKLWVADFIERLSNNMNYYRIDKIISCEKGEQNE